VRRVALLALLAVVTACHRAPRPAPTAAPPPPKVSVDESISDVATGGSWQEEGSSGRYRVVVRGGGRHDVQSTVVLQWLRWDEHGEAPVEVKSVRVAEVSRGGIAVTNSRIDVEDGHTVVRMNLVNPLTGAAGEARVWPQGVGKYRAKVKWAENTDKAQ
jgi:hypothetical protein